MNLEDDDVQSKYSPIYDSLITNAILKKNFVLFYLLRKFLWPLLIILFFNDPLYQLFGLICLNLSMITLLILKKPYKSKAICNEFILNEILVLVVLMILSTYLILGYLGEEYLDLSTVVKFGWILVGIVSSVKKIKYKKTYILLFLDHIHQIELHDLFDCHECWIASFQNKKNHLYH